MPSLFPRWTNAAARATVLVVVCLVVVTPLALMGWVRRPAASNENVAVSQPIAFDHRVHVHDLEIDCRFCHVGVESTPNAGLPPVSACMSCHNDAWRRSPTLAPVRASLDGRAPLVWQRVNALPDFVFFNHAIHVNKGVGCETCHGRVDQMAQVRQVTPMTMGWCLGCHRQPEAHLRPDSAITVMGWIPPEPQATLGPALAAQYHVQRLTNCSTCHR